jgi:hypothetical protein
MSASARPNDRQRLHDIALNDIKDSELLYEFEPEVSGWHPRVPREGTRGNTSAGGPVVSPPPSADLRLGRWADASICVGRRTRGCLTRARCLRQVLKEMRDVTARLAKEGLIEVDAAGRITKAATEAVLRLKTPGGEIMYRDMRKNPWLSIDNDDTRDLDQVNYAEDLGNGRVKILVGVADVDWFVQKDGQIDLHAQENTVTIYTPGNNFLMLPPELTYDVTSLNPDVDRRALVVEITYEGFESKAGLRIVEEDVYFAVVHNHCKLAYPSVGKWLAGEGPLPPGLARHAESARYAENVKLQDRIAQGLLAERRKVGTLEFDHEEASASPAGTR